MAIFFTADTRFGHREIIRMCERPYADAAEMDEALIGSWNAPVQPSDTVWHPGDFTMGRKRERLAQVFGRLNGTKRLVKGNHDGPKMMELGWPHPLGSDDALRRIAAWFRPLPIHLQRINCEYRDHLADLLRAQGTGILRSHRSVCGTTDSNDDVELAARMAEGEPDHWMTQAPGTAKTALVEADESYFVTVAHD